MNPSKRVKIGTRGSKLALYQADLVKKKLTENFKDLIFDIQIIKTKGDNILNKPLSEIGDKGLFTQELEEKLFSGEIDLAVHSLKDLPTVFPPKLILGAILERADSRDVLINPNGLKIEDLNSNHTIATSSLRRKASLLRVNPDLKVIDIRGNVDTRIRKLKDGYCDAIVMAAAGIIRLGLEEHVSEFIDKELIIPAPGQGAIAIEISEENSDIKKIVQEIHHNSTAISVSGERSFLNELQGGCQVPIGCYSKFENDQIILTGFISSIDGSTFIQKSMAGPQTDSVEIGRKLALEIGSAGGKEILFNIQNNK